MHAITKRFGRRTQGSTARRTRAASAFLPVATCLLLLFVLLAGCGDERGTTTSPPTGGQPSGTIGDGTPPDSTGGEVRPDTTGGGNPPEDPGGEVPPDSTGGGAGYGLVHIAADLDGWPLEGFSLGVVSDDGERSLRASGADGAVDFYLPAGHYTIAAVPTWFDAEAPWLRVLSIVPPEVEVAASGSLTSNVHVGRNPDVPQPEGRFVVWVGAPVDSTYGAPPAPPDPLPVEVTVRFAESGEVAAHGVTSGWTVEFPLAPGTYDVEVAVPDGYLLDAGSINPQRGIPLWPKQTRGVSFLLRPRR